MKSERANNDPKEILAAMERVLRAIRKDLGHDDRRLNLEVYLGC